jgi:hydrogenase expression/formation protein HypC
MCIGVPLQVETLDGEGLFAVCAADGQRERLDMRLVGEQPAGTWVLAFQGAARRVLEADEAQQVRAALQALDQVLHGDAQGLDALFADLIDREPQLPPHLRPAAIPAAATAVPAAAPSADPAPLP